MNPEKTIETIQMLELLRNISIKGFSMDGKGGTILPDVKHDSFTWVINQAIELLSENLKGVKNNDD